jgi:hypothetical protein
MHHQYTRSARDSAEIMLWSSRVMQTGIIQSPLIYSNIHSNEYIFPDPSQRELQLINISLTKPIAGVLIQVTDSLKYMVIPKHVCFLKCVSST